MGTKKRAADGRRLRDAEALLDGRYFVIDPERWAAFQAALDAPPRPNPRLRRLLQTPSGFEPTNARKRSQEVKRRITIRGFGLNH